jgi:hypothetical protein
MDALTLSENDLKRRKNALKLKNNSSILRFFTAENYLIEIV